MSNLIVYYRNVHGLRTKLKSLQRTCALLSPPPDIIVLTETYLHPGILDSELSLENFVIYRRDRHNTADAPSGGGILIAVKQNLKSQITQVSTGDLIIGDVHASEVEQLFVTISGLRKDTIVGTFYPIPRDDNKIYALHTNTCERIQSEYPENELLIIGDYNLPKTIWSNSGLLTDSFEAVCYHEDRAIKENVNTIEEGFSFLGFKQFYPVHPDKGYSLDLAFSTFEADNINVVPSVDSIVPVEALHHDPIFFSIKNCAMNFLQPK